MSEMTSLVRCDCGAWRAARGSRHVCAGVPRSVAAMHAMRRNAEPPAPWSLALAARRAAEGLPPVAAHRTSSEVPKPYTLALQRRAAEGR